MRPYHDPFCDLRFCDRHGVKESRGQSTPPGDLLAMAQIVIPRLCLRLHKQLRCMDPSLIGMWTPQQTCSVLSLSWQAFAVQPANGDFRHLWRAQTKRSLAVKFAHLALRWVLRAQIISTCKRLFASCFIWKGKLWVTGKPKLQKISIPS